MTVCNACRYCEGYCAVWKAMESRSVFKEADLNYLSNLCHNCSACYYSCQYSAPHEFNLNPPKTLAKLRVQSYAQYAWPTPLAAAFQKNGVLVAAVAALLLISLMVAGTLALGGRLFEPVVGADFFVLIPRSIMVDTFTAVSAFVAVALLMGFLRFWRDVGESYRTLLSPAAWGRALKDVLTMTNLDNDGIGCSYPTETASESRRWFHQSTMYGFLSCFVATSLGAVDFDVLGLPSPNPYGSLPVIFGSLGGIGLLVGTVGLLVLMRRRNTDIVDTAQDGMDVAFILLLMLIAGTGLSLLVLRQTGAMGSLLIVHLALVMTLLLTMPYGKFVHGIYRSGALLKWALERSRKATVAG
jgi:citrate/tricarballylate utilization protein